MLNLRWIYAKCTLNFLQISAELTLNLHPFSNFRKVLLDTFLHFIYALFTPDLHYINQDCFILDMGQSGVYAWIGKKATADERREAFMHAQVSHGRREKRSFRARSG